MSRLHRQGFLGGNSDAVLANATIGFVGLGGGGSHIVQQCSHAGVGGYVVVDPDTIDETNTNRLVGGSLADVAAKMPKVAIASRVIRGLNPKARVIERQCSWHEATDELKRCDVIIGAVEFFQRARAAGTFIAALPHPLYRYRHGCLEAGFGRVFHRRPSCSFDARKTVPAVLWDHH